MQKTFLIIAAIIAILAGGFFALNSYIYNEKQEDGTLVEDYKDGLYFISGEPVQLEDGFAALSIAPESSLIRTITYFGNEARGDLDGDGDEDIVFLITDESSGSGTFFYLVGAIKEEGGYRGTHAVLIGDRIAPQTTEYRDGQIIVNYADRAPGEAMTTAPSIGKSLYLKYDPKANSFGELVQDFEGEADFDAKDFKWIVEDVDDPSYFGPNQKVKVYVAPLDITYELGVYRLDCKGAYAAPLEEGQLSRRWCSYGGAGYEFGVFFERGMYFIKERLHDEGSATIPGGYGPWETRFEIR